MGFFYTYLFPIGFISIGEEDGNITQLAFDNEKIANYENKETEVIKKAANQLHEYFSGTRHEFDLPLKYINGTSFQHEVWDALKEIPYGKTVSYKDIAVKVNRPKAV